MYLCVCIEIKCGYFVIFFRSTVSLKGEIYYHFFFISCFKVVSLRQVLLCVCCIRLVISNVSSECTWFWQPCMNCYHIIIIIHVLQCFVHTEKKKVVILGRQ